MHLSCIVECHGNCVGFHSSSSYRWKVTEPALPDLRAGTAGVLDKLGRTVPWCSRHSALLIHAGSSLVSKQVLGIAQHLATPLAHCCHTAPAYTSEVKPSSSKPSYLTMAHLFLSFFDRENACRWLFLPFSAPVQHTSTKSNHAL